MTDRRDALGLESGHAMVVPYDPRWPGLFHEAAAEITSAVGDRVLSIDHVGSTSVPDLAAKPVLDILVGVADFQRSLQIAPDLAVIGYEYRPQDGIPDRHYFRRFAGGLRTHHLSLAEPTSSHYRNTLAFRDALRADPDLAASYEALKLELAHRFPRDRESYLDGKTDFVRDVLRRCASPTP